VVRAREPRALATRERTGRTGLGRRAVLATRGYRRLEDPGQRHRVLRLLPSRLEEARAVWAQGERLDWLVLYPARSSDALAEPAIFARPGAPKRPETGWTPLGQGGTALDETLRRLATLPAPAPVDTTKQRRSRSRPIVDGREIHY
jgi:hypothetical protein